jgi:hypothetical protein
MNSTLSILLAKGRHLEAVDRVLINDGRGNFTFRDLGTAKDPSYSALLADVDGDRDLDGELRWPAVAFREAPPNRPLQPKR